jgi:hypothetical protein
MIGIGILLEKYTLTVSLIISPIIVIIFIPDFSLAKDEESL